MFLRSKKGYTLIELLIVIGIIAVLLSIAVPVISGVISTSRLKLDKDVAQSYQTAISLWTSEQPTDQIAYFDNLNTSNNVGSFHNELSYTNAYMGTQQLPGVEFTNANDIRNAVLTAIKSLTKDKIETHNVDDLYLHHPQSVGYGYKYYYRVGIVSVERTDSLTNSYTGTGYEYFIWLDYNPTSPQQISSDTIMKFEKIIGATDSSVPKPTFSFSFSIENGESVSKCVYTIENEHCSYTLSGKNLSPQVFTEGIYNIKYYYQGELRYNSPIKVETSDIIDSVVTVSFSNNSLQFATSVSYFDYENGTIKGLKSLPDDVDTIVIPSKIGMQTITTISSNAFNNCKATKIILPSTINLIQSNAFSNCQNLEYISLPSPTLENRAIVACSNLKTIEFYIPSNVTNDMIRSVYDNAIVSCGSLTNLSFTSVYRNFSNTSFQTILTENANIKISIALSKEECPISLLNNSKISFDMTPKSFFKITANSVKINSTATLSSYNKLYIPHRINKPTYGSSNNFITDNSNIYTLTKISGSNSYTKTELDGLKNFRSTFDQLIIDSGYTIIEDEAFKGFQFSSIALPSTVTTIGEKAFAGNKCLSLEIPESVTSVKDRAFSSETIQTISIRCDLSALNSQSLIGCSRVTTLLIYNFDGDESVIKPENFGLNENVKIVFM